MDRPGQRGALGKRDVTEGVAQVSIWAKYGRLGSIIRSWDFEISLPVAIALGALPAYSHSVADGVVPLLITYAGVLAALLAVVLAAITLFATLIGPEYLALLERVRGGVKGAIRPYYFVALICAIGIATSFVAALAWPAIPDHQMKWLQWIVFSLPTWFMLWAVFGSVQLVALGNLHIQRRTELLGILRDVRKQGSRSA